MSSFISLSLFKVKKSGGDLISDIGQGGRDGNKFFKMGILS
jgi:hypothetical protein